MNTKTPMTFKKHLSHTLKKTMFIWLATLNSQSTVLDTQTQNYSKTKYENYSANKGGLKIDLNKNFRSRDEVLNNINEMFNQIMDSDIGGADYITSHQMIFGNTAYNEIHKENYNMEILKLRNT